MNNLDIKMVVEEVTGIFDIGIKSRSRTLTDARFVYYALSKKYLGNRFRTSATGRQVNRDHSTVVHGLKQFDILYEVDSLPTKWMYQICEIKLREKFIEARILPPPFCRRKKYQVSKVS